VPWDSENNYGRFEVQINRFYLANNPRVVAHHCAYGFFGLAIQARYGEALSATQNTLYPNNVFESMCITDSIDPVDQSWIQRQLASH